MNNLPWVSCVICQADHFPPLPSPPILLADRKSTPPPPQINKQASLLLQHQAVLKGRSSITPTFRYYETYRKKKEKEVIGFFTKQFTPLLQNWSGCSARQVPSKQNWKSHRSVKSRMLWQAQYEAVLWMMTAIVMNISMAAV